MKDILRPGTLARSRPADRAVGWIHGIRPVLPLLAMLVVMAVAADALGCPTCKDGVAESDPEGMNVARGYFYSILLMLGMPFTLAGSFGVYVWREMRRQERDRLRAGPEAPASSSSLSASTSLSPSGGVVRGA